MLFHEILLQERKRRGLSQEALAAKIGVSRQAVSKWETGDAQPDLNKLLALADALELSLDALCGRQPPPSSTAADSPMSKKALPLFLLIPLALLLVFALCCLRDPPSLPESSVETPLPEEFTVSGVAFHPNSDYRVDFQFTPGVSGEALTYQITFTDHNGSSFTFDAPCSGGVCAGTAVFDTVATYTVTVSVSNGTVSRNLAIASDLTFREGSTSYLPLTP